MIRASKARLWCGTRAARWTLLFALCAVSSCSRAGPTAPPEGDGVASSEDELVQQGVVLTMSGHLHDGPHMEMTSLRPGTATDEARARDILSKLRDVLSRYHDVDAARRDGYAPFLPQVEQHEYHFTSLGRSLASAVELDPAEPSALLYERHGDTWKLVGAMYTAPQGSSLEDLDARVPLSHARWHAHVNVCLPPLDMIGSVDWSRFGPQGSIATRDACGEAGGRFASQIFGWMVHVYPFADDPADVWGR